MRLWGLFLIAALPADLSRDLSQLEAEAQDIRELCAQLLATGEKTKAAGRPVSLGPLQADVVELQIALGNLELLVQQLERDLLASPTASQPSTTQQ